MKANGILPMSLLGFTSLLSCGCKELGAVSEGVGYAYYGGASALTVADSAAKEHERGGGSGPSSPKEVRRLEAQEAEIHRGLPQLRVGMTVAEVGTLMPHTFDRRVRKNLLKCPAFTASLHGYNLEFRQGVLHSIVSPPALPPTTPP